MDAEPVDAEPVHAAVAPAPAPLHEPTLAERRARYSLPWALRPAIAPDIVRLDTAIAVQDATVTIVPVLTAGYKPIAAAPDLGFYLRGAVVLQRPEDAASSAGLSNPAAFVLFTPELAPRVRLALFAGLTLPLGSGAGADPSSAARAAVLAGAYARQSMDNALFLPNYLTPAAGVSLAWVDRGWTVQADATALQLVRVRAEAVDSDAMRTSATFGLHVGYRVLPPLTASIEAHHQRFVSTPAFVRADEASRDQTTVGGGLRLNLAISDGVITRPGVAYFRPVDDPMVAAGYHVIVVDVPVAF